MGKDVELKIKLLNHQALHALTHGQGTKQDWDIVCNALNTSLALAEMGYGPEYHVDVIAGMRAHSRCKKRLTTHGKLGYTGEEIALVNYAIELYEAQAEIVPVVEMEQAHLAVATYLASGKPIIQG